MVLLDAGQFASQVGVAVLVGLLKLGDGLGDEAIAGGVEVRWKDG